MTSASLFSLVQCPDCASSIVPADRRARCVGCGREFALDAGYLDLRPRQTYEEQTKYLDEALHADARHEHVAPPLLGSKVRNDMLRQFLRPAAGDRVLDLGCGSGRTLAWNARTGAALTGIDIAPFFAQEAVRDCDLLLGDLRQLPLRNASFNKAWSLDVLEHLSKPALIEMLKQANRILQDDGGLFVYTHVRKNGWIAGGVRLVNRLARVLERAGLLDLKQERLRKSDHLNPLTDHDDLARVAEECGFRIDRITYYTPVIGSFVENILARMAEKLLVRRATKSGVAAGEDAQKAARAAAQARVRQGGAIYAALSGLSAVMKLDVLLFGRMKSGPFFALLRKTRAV